ncbi:MAG: nucleoid-associated protein [Firmicutes bacterium]|nr:nucleoid-associated protein [Bacillota bacterium]
MALVIKNAILHILCNDGRPSVFSDAELDIDSEICEAFILKHVKKLINNPAVRTANFKAESPIYSLLREYQEGRKYFKDTTLELAARMDEIMNRYKDILPCDMLIARVGHKSGEYLAILKLTYQEVYSHKTTGTDIQLKTCNALPFNTGKVEYAALVGLNGASMPISVVEKPAAIDGNQVLYFSELFLECETTPSKKEQAKLIDEVTVEFVEEHFESDPKVSAKIKTALLEEVYAEEGFVSMDNVAAAAFEDQEEIKTQYVSIMRDAGIKEELPLGEKVVKAQFATHKIKAENGVEIKFPAQLAAEEDEIEITKNPDGTVTVVFKNLRVV